MTQILDPSSDAAADRAAEQARIRKERREAKIRAGGSARLNKITGLGGGLQRDDPPRPTESVPSSQHGDPDEVDISQHFYTPQNTRRMPSNMFDSPSMSDPQLQRLLTASGGGSGQGTTPPPPMSSAGTPSNAAEDPMMAMLQQMMSMPGAGGPGGGDGAASAENPFAAFPGFAQSFGTPPNAAVPSNSYAAIWRLLHFTLAVGLGLYIAMMTTFTGSKIQRERGAFVGSVGSTGFDGFVEKQEDLRRWFFWMFATAETVLLSSRFFLDRGRAPPAGMVWTLMGFLPEPYKGYLALVMRYGQIFSTVRGDFLVCIFVLGVCSWLRHA